MPHKPEKQLRGHWTKADLAARRAKINGRNSGVLVVPPHNGTVVGMATSLVSAAEADLQDAEARGVHEAGLIRRRATLHVAEERLVKILEQRESVKAQLIAHGSTPEAVEAADRRVTAQANALAYYGSAAAAADSGWEYGMPFELEEANG
jgi:hypothetical protein